jgi:hypothetical protein
MTTFRYVKWTTSLYLIFGFIFGYLPSFIAIYNSDGSFPTKISVFLVLLLSFTVICVSIFTPNIVIDKNCIIFHSLFKKYRILWDDVKEVGITNIGPYGTYSRLITKEFLYFSTEENVSRVTTYLELSDRIIFLRNREPLIKEVGYYWGKEIKGLTDK